MPLEYKYYETEGYVLTSVSNVVSLADAITHFDKLIDDPSIRKPFFEIVDFSRTGELDFGYEQSKILMQKIKILQRLGSYQGSLLIADKDYIRGMTNIFRVAGETKQLNVIQVASLKEALDIVRRHFAS